MKKSNSRSTKTTQKTLLESCACNCHGTNATVSGTLITIGALNWGLVGLGRLLGQGNWNIINWLLGSWPIFENLIYLLVGLAGIIMLINLCKDCS